MHTFEGKHLSEPWFSLIKLGLKKCEGRLRKGYFSKMNKGDEIIFVNNDFGRMRSIRCKITSIHHYDTFEEYLMNETLEKCLPGMDTMEDGLSVYYKYFKASEEAEYKIVAVRLRMMK